MLNVNSTLKERRKNIHVYCCSSKRIDRGRDEVRASPGSVAVLNGPETYSCGTDGAGEGLDDPGHEALHLQEVSLADAGGAVHQEDDVCCLHIVAPPCKHTRGG